ncbi:M24 family metallopeptidase [Paenibacillus protaetiae]|uniref:Aminopeptidase P family protein n=1 Tax=Paenibacillus protaetiae TaxID=2509456 RepID=A0A4P6F9J4_9BACL|nr:Xaa-Pro peptidase family protein [Paenibacillus protaetiae]QAY67158.1 aminopeptidase P family protein [Paenibacillus protaetiae]
MADIWQERKRKLAEYMRGNGIDAAFISSPMNVYYFTGFHTEPHERFLALYIEAGGEETLYVPLLELTAAEEAGKVQRAVPVSDTDDPFALLRSGVTGSIQTLGIEKNAVSVLKGEQLQAVFGGVQFADLESFILSLRMNKSEEEISKVQYAVDLVEQVVDYAAKHAVAGMTEAELTAEIEFQMRKLGADRPAFESIVLTGARTALPHGRPGNYPIRQGDFVLIDIGVQAGGYCSDTTRTFVMGEGTKEQIKIYETVLAANEAAIRRARAGIPLADVDRAAREVIEAEGFGHLFTHRVGHGFGMEVHEQPSVSGHNQSIIEPGLLFTIEPGIYDSVIGGVRIEDDIYIQSDGQARVLTRYPKTLIHLGR